MVGNVGVVKKSFPDTQTGSPKRVLSNVLIYVSINIININNIKYISINIIFK